MECLPSSLLMWSPLILSGSQVESSKTCQDGSSSNRHCNGPSESTGKPFLVLSPHKEERLNLTPFLQECIQCSVVMLCCCNIVVVVMLLLL